MGMKDIANNREANFPPEGWEGKVRCIDARAKSTNAGYPAFGLWLEIVDGADQGRSFWDNIYFSANANFNHQSLTKLEAAGVEPAFWDSDPEPDPQVIDKLTGLVFNIRATYDPNDNDPSNPWLRCTYFPAEGTAEQPAGF